ncbi:MAG: ABC transporter permease [Muribaculaceae bacterium]|nr:ABC transporter permease [Roseburia sp.]MCM1430643.1 ABC transporter permease [Muribaculaceae bacterium]MCM1491910.1 ABC transporter permease [Muribaculaceae bacterium]
MLLEYKKTKNSGFFPAFFAGGFLAAVIPVIHTAARANFFTRQAGTPVSILLDANGQFMSMLHVLLLVAASCLLYNIEYADNAMTKMRTLPLRESAVFFGKVALTLLMSLLALAMEAAGILLCSCRYFTPGPGLWTELFQSFGYTFFMLLPCTVLSLLISEACKNMWTSLGIQVICVFAAAMLPEDSFLCSLFPYALPFLSLADTGNAAGCLWVAVAELAVFSLAELIFIKAGRLFT